jgi:hypothetical protein
MTWIWANHSNFEFSLGTALSDNGDTPVPGCSFNFDSVLTDVATMASVARVVEHVGVGAYLGGLDILDDKNFVAAAATIMTTEARHQSFLNVLAGATSIPQPLDVALTPPDVLSIAGAFISGCDPATAIGLPPANPPLAVTNTGPIGAGTLLEFSSPALNSTSQSTAFCQMLVGGQVTSLSFPIDQCIVPSGINGPVWIYLTNDPQPLAANIHVRASVNIVAGPTAAFIDSVSDALGSLVRPGSGFNSSGVISPSQAQSQLNNATTPLPTGITEVPANAAATPDPNAQITVAPVSLSALTSIPASYSNHRHSPLPQQSHQCQFLVSHKCEYIGLRQTSLN